MDAALPPLPDIVENSLVKRLHQLPDFQRAILPVPQYPLRQDTQQSERVHGRRGAQFLHQRPFVHQIEELAHVLVMHRFGSNPKDERIGDTITVPLGMQHVVFRHGEEVVQHLLGLCFLHLPVLSFAVGLHEILMDDLAEHAPLLPVLHDQQMVALGDQVRYQRCRPVGVYVALLAQEGLDQFSIRDDHRRVVVSLQREHSSIFLGPFGKSS